MSLQEVPQDVLQDVIALQGKELIRLRQALAAAEARIRMLEGRKSTSEDFGPVSIATHLPAYEGLHPLQLPGKTGKAVRKLITSLKAEKSPRLLLRPGAALCDEDFDTCSLIKPTKYLNKRQNLTAQKVTKLRKTHEVVARLDETWYYMGTYDCVELGDADPSVYGTLPVETQELLLEWAGSSKHKAAVLSKIQSGEIPLCRISFRRTGFNQALYEPLLGTSFHREQSLAEGSAEHEASDRAEVSDAEEY